MDGISFVVVEYFLQPLLSICSLNVCVNVVTYKDYKLIRIRTIRFITIRVIGIVYGLYRNVCYIVATVANSKKYICVLVSIVCDNQSYNFSNNLPVVGSGALEE